MSDPASTSFSGSSWEPPLPEELQAGLPQYEIVGILGRGGMGAVYKGRQAHLDRDIAIKVLPKGLAADDDPLRYAERFLQEARAMARLSHPGIVSVYGFGETQTGLLYFAMEYIDGLDVHRYLDLHGGRLAQEVAIAIASHLLDALGYAHARGIVHRDVKPANVLVDREGRIKVADFGLAKSFGKGLGDTGLTMGNLALGTPDYIAPESLDPSRVPDHRADLYAVGVMLYKMLTGKLPRGSFKLPSRYGYGIDPRLDAVVVKALAADPGERHRSAAELRAELEALVREGLWEHDAPAGEAVPEVPATTRARTSRQERSNHAATRDGGRHRHPALWWGSGAVLAALAVAVLALIARPGSENADNGTFTDNSSVSPAPRDSAPPDAPSQPETAPAETRESPEPSVAAAPPAAASDIDRATPPAPAPPPPMSPETAAPPAESASSTPTPRAAPAPGTEPREAKPAGPASSPPPPPPPTDSTEIVSLAAIPGFASRIDRFLQLRKEAIGRLGATYLANLRSRSERSADGGNLTMLRAYEGEIATFEELLANLDPPSSNAAAKITATRDRLNPPTLAESAPEELHALRAAWKRESGKQLNGLYDTLDRSLEALLVERTRARDLDAARRISHYAESLPAFPVGTRLWTREDGTRIRGHFLAFENEGKQLVLISQGSRHPLPYSSLDQSTREKALDSGRAAGERLPTEIVVDLGLEDNALGEITVTDDSKGPVLLKTRPGRGIRIECGPDPGEDNRRYLRFHADGYASHSLGVYYENGVASIRSDSLILHRLRYATIRFTWNRIEGRALEGEGVEEVLAVYTHSTSPGPSGLVVRQSGETEHFGSGVQIWLHSSYVGGGCGFMEPNNNETYATMREAPEEGYRTTDRPRQKGDTGYFRTYLGNGRTLFYGKYLVEDISESPPEGIEIKMRQP